jgi:hypothetical protein
MESFYFHHQNESLDDAAYRLWRWAVRNRSFLSGRAWRRIRAAHRYAERHLRAEDQYTAAGFSEWCRHIDIMTNAAAWSARRNGATIQG